MYLRTQLVTCNEWIRFYQFKYHSRFLASFSDHFFLTTFLTTFLSTFDNGTISTFDEPIVRSASLCREVDTNKNLLAVIEGPWQGVLLGFDLVKGDASCGVDLALDDVDKLVGTEEQIDTAIRGLVFGIDLQTHQLAQDI